MAITLCHPFLFHMNRPATHLSSPISFLLHTNSPTDILPPCLPPFPPWPRVPLPSPIFNLQRNPHLLAPPLRICGFLFPSRCPSLRDGFFDPHHLGVSFVIECQKPSPICPKFGLAPLCSFRVRSSPQSHPAKTSPFPVSPPA